MSSLPNTSPTAFCKAFIKRELASFRQKDLYVSYWPVMERIIDREQEFTAVFDEIINKYGFSDKYDRACDQSSKEAVWLILEHVWMSNDYCKDDIVQARTDRKALEQVNQRVIQLSEELHFALNEQSELYERSGFSPLDYQSSVDVLELAGSKNGLYSSYISKKIRPLSGQFDLRYWPDRADLVEAITTFEKAQSQPRHYELTDVVLNGRETIAKDFVISFDNQFVKMNGLPKDFRFSNKALAVIINIVLNLEPEQLVDDTSVRTIRHRYKNVKC